MTKFVIVLVAAAIIESIGVALLGWGLKDVQGVREITVSEIVRVVKSGVTNVKIIGGVALEAVFFGALLYMMSTRAVSFVWPLTSLGFIFTTLAAQFLLHERVSAVRWAGVLLIAFGAALTGYSEAAKNSPAPPPANSAPLGSQ
jgi:drug/metabolite transporter (DMT)-like permease